MPRHVVCIPSADEAFHEAASDALNRIAARADRNITAHLLVDVLRGRYPAVAVHPQHEAARIHDDDRWYAYRDGEARPD
jgi:hypothetical protein